MIDFSQVTEIMLGSSVVEQIMNSRGDILWSKSGDDPANSYFYVEDASGEDSIVNVKKRNSTDPTVTVYYSTDRQNWELMGNSDTTEITAQLPANGKIYLKSTNSNWSTASNSGNNIYSNRRFNVGGNIMSLIYGDNFYGQTSFPTNTTYNFSNLFTNGILIDASKLVLPATTLTTACYQNMFYTSAITQAPELPATTLTSNCYSGMFQNCTSLTTAPAILPATTLAESCYESMFQGCTALTAAPELPATSLANSCYSGMFSGCTSLTTAPVLPATTLVIYCYRYMFYQCTSLTTAPELPATTLARMCYEYMFSGCTSLTTAPAILPATTLAESCYESMFKDCTSLTTAPELPATTLAQYCYSSMFRGCTSLTTAPELPATTLAQSCYNQMFRYSSVKSVTTYAQDISATNCLNDWLSGVPSTGTFHNMSCITYPSGTSGIPSGWTEVHSSGNAINVTITNTSNYTGATYQIDSDTAQPINETGTTSFTVPTTATTLTIHRNGKGTTDVGGICGISGDTDWDAALPVNKMSDNVSIDLMSLM